MWKVAYSFLLTYAHRSKYRESRARSGMANQALANPTNRRESDLKYWTWLLPENYALQALIAITGCSSHLSNVINSSEAPGMTLQYFLWYICISFSFQR